MPRVGVVFALVLYGMAGSGEAPVSVVPRSRPEPAAGPARNIRVDVKLMQVPVSVTDERHRPVTDLPRSTFHIFEDGVEQEIASYSLSDSAVSMGILFDSS